MPSLFKKPDLTVCKWISRAQRILRAVSNNKNATGGLEIFEKNISDLTEAEKRISTAIIRVNHSGEIAAQGLYIGQALLARDDEVFEFMLESAEEEVQHLRWCIERLKQLGEKESLFTPFWLAGSIAIGFVAALPGDKFSLGFISETEKQVAEHLQDCLRRVSPNDSLTIQIMRRMQQDEIGHGDAANNKGGLNLPPLLKVAMAGQALIMKELSARI